MQARTFTLYVCEQSCTHIKCGLHVHQFVLVYVHCVHAHHNLHTMSKCISASSLTAPYLHTMSKCISASSLTAPVDGLVHAASLAPAPSTCLLPNLSLRVLECCGYKEGWRKLVCPFISIALVNASHTNQIPILRHSSTHHHTGHCV